MQLVEKGLVDLDAPLETYIPDFSVLSRFDDAALITPRSIMAHHSGLTGEKLKGRNCLRDEGPPEDFRELVSYFPNEHVAYPPRFISAYSNIGVSLLGILIENVDGRNFNDYVRDEILIPLGMVDSGSEYQPHMQELMANGYLDSKQNAMPPISMRDVPAGAMISSVADMTGFIRAILAGGVLEDHRILDEATLQNMFEQQNADIPLDFPNDHGAKWGLSWILGDSILDYAGPVVGHDSGTSYFFSDLKILLDQGLGVIVTSNSKSGASAVSEIATEAMVKALEILRDIEKPAVNPLPPVREITAEDLLRMPGDYASNGLGIFRIRSELGELTLRIQDDLLNLIPHTDDWFSLHSDEHGAVPSIRISVQAINDENILAVEVRNDQGLIFREPWAVEYDAPDSIDPIWEGRIGRWQVSDQDAPNPPPMDQFIEIQKDLESSALLAISTYDEYDGIFILNPASDTEAIRVGRGRNMNDTVYFDVHEGKQILRYSGLDFEKVEVPVRSYPVLDSNEIFSRLRNREQRYW